MPRDNPYSPAATTDQQSGEPDFPTTLQTQTPGTARRTPTLPGRRHLAPRPGHSGRPHQRPRTDHGPVAAGRGEPATVLPDKVQPEAFDHRPIDNNHPGDGRDQNEQRPGPSNRQHTQQSPRHHERAQRTNLRHGRVRTSDRDKNRRKQSRDNRHSNRAQST